MAEKDPASSGQAAGHAAGHTTGHTAGMKTRRAVLGDRHVDRAEAAVTPFDADFQRLITELAWGAVWSRETITLRERSMVTIAILAALGREEELRLHLRAIHNTGASADDIKEVLLHVSVYAGVPAANTAFRVAKAVFSESDDGHAS